MEKVPDDDGNGMRAAINDSVLFKTPKKSVRSHKQQEAGTHSQKEGSRVVRYFRRLATSIRCMLGPDIFSELRLLPGSSQICDTHVMDTSQFDCTA